LNIVLRRILFYFCFSNAVWASASGGFRIVFDTLVLHYFAEPDLPLFAHFEAGLSIHPSIYLKSGNKAHRTGTIQRKR